MRPYVAIILDSFREALYSRVLWVLLIFITLLLLALAPLSAQFLLTTRMSGDSIESMPGFAQRLEAASGEDSNAPRNVIWTGLTEDLQDKLGELAEDKTRDRRTEFEVRQQLVRELNGLIEKEDLFSPETLDQISFPEEGEELLAREEEGKLAEIEMQRLNRLALESAFRRDIVSGPSKSVQFKYLTFDVGTPLPLSRERLQEIVKMALAGFMELIGATLGVFVAILVTASIIPNMFDSGSVNLLFSKPIVRSLLYLAKFFGGCWFVFINTTYLIIGIYFIAGWRFDVWHNRLLWVIPILMFLFAVYYSVSAFAGLVWRNTIMAVVAAILFWAACFGIGTAYGIVEGLMMNPRRVVKAVLAGDTVITVAESGAVNAWSADKNGWEPAFEDPGDAAAPAFARQNRLLGPVYEPAKGRILAISRQFSRSRFIAGYEERDWAREELDTAPSGCVELLREPTDTWLVVESKSFSRIAEAKEKSNEDIKIFGMEFTLGAQRGSFRPASPKGDQPRVAYFRGGHQPGQRCALIYGGGQLQRFSREASADRYDLQAEREILTKEDEALVATTGDVVLLADEKGQIQLLDLANLEPLASFQAFTNTAPRFAAAAPGGKYLAVLYHNKRVWLYDFVSKQDLSSRLSGQGSMTSVVFTGANSILVADRVDRVRNLSLPNGKEMAVFAPKLSLLDRVHRYGLSPLYHIFPMPGKLKDTSSYLLTEQASVAVGEDQSLSGARVQIDPWQPVWSSSVFVVVMLMLACVYIHWQEF